MVQAGSSLQLAAVDGSSVRRVPIPFIARPGIKWHPNGQRLLMLGREKAGAPLSVYAVAINGDTPVVVAPVGSTPDEAALAVSPDS
jgi:hypothetical protein